MSARRPRRERTGEWFAELPEGFEGVESEEDFTLESHDLRFMWDYGVVVPLWVSGQGLVPDDKEWLRRALGLRYPLVSDLRASGEAMEMLDANPGMRTDQAYAELDRRARTLVERVREELGPDFTVTYVPW
ncbi:hypothetical protein [Nocardioides sp. LML1-1-1.1]|uniref:hypothetical protein n=1 Tax=Nocardioides sp. LML1-1-1.1 TaxID=3135248 RepID=UPI003436346C